MTNQSDETVVSTNKLSIMYDTLRGWDKFDYNGKFSIELFSSDQSVCKILYDNKTVEIAVGETSSVATYEYNYTSVAIISGKIQILSIVNYTEYKNDTEFFAINQMTVRVDTPIYKSDINRCISFNEQPTYVTEKYMNCTENPVYGDLKIKQDSSLFEKETILPFGRNIAIYALSEGNTTISLEFKPLNETQLTCVLYLTAYQNGETTRKCISVPFVCRFSDLMEWSKYYGNESSFLKDVTKLTLYYKESESIYLESVWLFDDNIVTNRVFPACLITYRFLYTYLSSRKSIVKNELHVDSPKYDRFYPVSLNMGYNAKSVVDQYPTTARYKWGLLFDLLSIIPSPLSEIPSNVFDIMQNDSVVMFYVLLEKVSDVLNSVTDKRYMPLSIYMKDGEKKIMTSGFTGYYGVFYPLSDFEDCFSIDFANRTMVEKADSYDVRKIKYFFPCDMSYGVKEIIPVGFSSPRYITYYTNKLKYGDCQGYYNFKDLTLDYFAPELITSICVLLELDNGDVYVNFVCINGKLQLTIVQNSVVMFTNSQLSIKADKNSLELLYGDNYVFKAYPGEQAEYNTEVNLGYGTQISAPKNTNVMITHFPLMTSSRYDYAVNYFLNMGYYTGFKGNHNLFIIVVGNSIMCIETNTGDPSSVVLYNDGLQAVHLGTEVVKTGMELDSTVYTRFYFRDENGSVPILVVVEKADEISIELSYNDWFYNHGLGTDIDEFTILSAYDKNN